MWIANFSKENIEKGLHFAPNNNTILIQIQDPDTKEFVKSPYFKDFKEIHQFKFWDAEDITDLPNGITTGIITNEQSNEIALILETALKQELNIIVHCHAGICRSGAIVEAGSLLGFEVPEGINKRIPNRLVLKKIRTSLGLTFSWEE